MVCDRATLLGGMSMQLRDIALAAECTLGRLSFPSTQCLERVAAPLLKLWPAYLLWSSPAAFLTSLINLTLVSGSLSRNLIKDLYVV